MNHLYGSASIKIVSLAILVYLMGYIHAVLFEGLDGGGGIVSPSAALISAFIHNFDIYNHRL